MNASTVVKRTAGFGRAFAFVAETTVATSTGDLVTTSEFGHTADGAAFRSQLAARDRAVFARAKRVTGFVKDTVFRTANKRADFALGFA